MITEWEKLERECLGCTKCELHETRTNVVFGRGNPLAQVLFVGEAPGKDEDLQGRPFVGRAGVLLDKIIAAAGLDETDYYIANILKCRPPANRDPKPEEKEICIDHLREQFRLMRPKIIVCLGRIAAQAIISADFKITAQRGQWSKKGDTWLTAVFHPAALLRDPRKKAPTWEDFQEIKRKMEELGLEREESE